MPNVFRAPRQRGLRGPGLTNEDVIELDAKVAAASDSADAAAADRTASEAAADLAELWANSEGQAPGGVGSKSAKEWADTAEDAVVSVTNALDDVNAEIDDLTTVVQTNQEAGAVSIEELDARLWAVEQGRTINNGDLIEVEIMSGDAFALDPNINPNGSVVRFRFKGISPSSTFDRTKATFRLKRPGYGEDRQYYFDNVIEQCAVTGLARYTYPNGTSKIVNVVGSDLDVYCFTSARAFIKDRIDRIEIQAGFYGACTDSIVGAGANGSTKPYEKPGFGWNALDPFVRIGSTGGISPELMVVDSGARYGKPCAAVDIYVEDALTTPGRAVRTVTTMTASTTTQPYTVPVFKPSSAIVATGLTDGPGKLGALIYPWIGDQVWDTATLSPGTIADVNVPGHWPVMIDAAGNYRPAYAYVSHTGATIGSPAVSTTAPGAYNPGVTAAYASVSALAAAVKTFNNARGHNDIDAGVALIPHGNIIAGFGASMASAATYTCGVGPLFQVTREAGATRATTGMTSHATAANKTRPAHFCANGILIEPGAAGATHTVFDGSTAGQTTSAHASIAVAAITVIRDCEGVGVHDNSNPPMYRNGYAFIYNNDFEAFGDDYLLSNSIYYAGVVAICGGTYDNRGNTGSTAVTNFTGAVVSGAQFYDMCSMRRPVGEVQQRKGQLHINYRCDIRGIPQKVVMYGNDNGVDDRGYFMQGLLIRQTYAGGTPGDIDGSGEQPALNFHGDYVTGPAETPTCRNVVIQNCSFAGGRSNVGYNEVGTSRVLKEFYISFSAFDKFNVKGDYKVTPSPASGVRTGNFDLRWGVSVLGLRVALDASNTGGQSPDSWGGDAPWPGTTKNVGLANMYVDNTSLGGTNDPNDDGDFRAAAALQNAIPAGRAPTLCDMLGTTIPDDGTGASGALQP